MPMPMPAHPVARGLAASLAIALTAIATPVHGAGHSCFIDRVESVPEGVRVYFDTAADSTVSVRLKGETAYTRSYRTRDGKLRPGDDDQAVEQAFVPLAEGDGMSMLNGPYDRCTVEVARHGGYIGVLAANVVSEPSASRVQEEFIPALVSATAPH
ncbi:hypothetical protein IEQ11_09695 [Lysobacter capsici]|uniref:hypothetical protein n=1 Tax=Lysobacter capsici TaxID=435897 RepID=UPI00178657C7|nr:hypothetical protein [Lysobacter capsici]UOF16882.1 hypothetical protein IEQ11_09695 [Lysobacter capsici]